jgi:hypothetical protein
VTTRRRLPRGAGTLPALALCAGLVLGLACAGCGIETQEYGNVITDCPAGTSCSCGTGNCVMSCVGGGCDFLCGGYSNCDFDCSGGGCTVSCANTGNCFVGCSGNGCDVTCTNVGNCGLTECTSDCTLTCANTGNCL